MKLSDTCCGLLYTFPARYMFPNRVWKFLKIYRNLNYENFVKHLETNLKIYIRDIELMNIRKVSYLLIDSATVYFCESSNHEKSRFITENKQWLGLLILKHFTLYKTYTSNAEISNDIAEKVHISGFLLFLIPYVYFFGRDQPKQYKNNNSIWKWDFGWRKQWFVWQGPFIHSISDGSLQMVKYAKFQS